MHFELFPFGSFSLWWWDGHRFKMGIIGVFTLRNLDNFMGSGKSTPSSALFLK